MLEKLVHITHRQENDQDKVHINITLASETAESLQELLVARGSCCRVVRERLTAVGLGWHALSHLAI